MAWLSEDLTAFGFAAAIFVTIFAGFVKGAIGFALPLIMVSGLSMFLSPTVTVAAILLPVLVSNLMQASRFGFAEAQDAIAEHWRYMLIVCVSIIATAQILSLIDPQSFYLVLGIPVVILSLIQLLGVTFSVAPERRRVTEWGVGLVAGGLGGLTGAWGPPTVLYLMALGTEKKRQILVQGVVYGLGAVALFSAHLYSGVFNAQTARLSAALLIPAAIGMYLGFRFSDRLNPKRFRQITLAVLLVAGVNLIRRGIFG